MTTLSSPVAVPSVVITVTAISDDDGLVRFNVIISVSWPSNTETDDVLKQITVATIEIKGHWICQYFGLYMRAKVLMSDIYNLSPTYIQSYIRIM